MPFKLFLSREFEKELSKLDSKVQSRVIEKLKDIKEDPKFFGKPLRYRLKGLWSCRVGKYRIIYVVEREVITVVTVRHRKEAY